MKSIKITCRGADVVDYKKIKDFQGDLKYLSPGSLEKLIAQILKHGFNSPIHIWKNSKTLWNLDGHQRKTALKALEARGYVIPHVPIDFIEAKTVKEAKEILLSKVSEFGHVTEKGLYNFTIDAKIEPIEIKNNYDIPGVDFGVYQELYGRNVEGEPLGEHIPEPPAKPISKVGDIWVLGHNRLMCGDSTSLSDIKKLMNGESPDFIHTDPPYGMNAVTKSGVLSKNYKTDIMGDDNPDIAKKCFSVIQKLYPKSKQIWWGANYYSSSLPDSENWIVWNKNNGGADQADCELAWGNFRTVVRMFTMSSEKINRVHPTQKPVELIEWFLESHRFKISPRLMADFFGGSGSTLMAAQKKDIPCHVMEFDPRFVDTIILRWEGFFGKKASLFGKNKTFEQIKKERSK